MNVAPWELLKQPRLWRQWGQIALVAESEAQTQRKNAGIGS